MVSIKHFEDLRPSEILESLDLEWTVTEKLDGSYFRAGIDDTSQFYTQRKHAPPCYQLSDWGDEAWAQAYRSGHIMATMVFQRLEQLEAMRPGCWIDFELIYGCMPNTVPYVMPEGIDGKAFVINFHGFGSSDLDWFDKINKIFGFQCSFSIDSLKSPDGMTIASDKTVNTWSISYSKTWTAHLVKARLSRHALRLKTVLNDWFVRESKINGFSILEVLEISLNKKHPNCGDRNWSELKEQLKKEREELSEVFHSMVMIFKDLVLRVLHDEMPSSVGGGSGKEGFVVQRNQKLFKLVDRTQFSEANKFTHMVKYWLVGGRRPTRPSFLDRTKDWPIDKRLERLEILRKRYEKYRWSYHFTFKSSPRQIIIMYSNELHQRILNLFADTRKRIIDGR